MGGGCGETSPSPALVLSMVSYATTSCVKQAAGSLQQHLACCIAPRVAQSLLVSLLLCATLCAEAWRWEVFYMV